MLVTLHPGEREFGPGDEGAGPYPPLHTFLPPALPFCFLLAFLSTVGSVELF